MFSNPEFDSEISKKAFVLDGMIATTIASDFSPQQRTDEIEFPIQYLRDIDGKFFIRTTETQTSRYELGEEKLLGSQTFLLRHPSSENDITLVDFSYENDDVSLYINAGILERIELEKLFVSDFYKYGIMAEIIFEQQLMKQTETDYINNYDFMWLMRANAQWPFIDSLPQRTIYNYSVLRNNTLCQIKTVQNLDGGMHRLIKISETGHESIDEVEIFRNGQDIKLLKPTNEHHALDALDVACKGVDTLFK